MDLSFSGDPENPFLGSLKRVNEYEENGNKTAAVALRVVLLLEVQYLETQNPLLEMRAEVGEDVEDVARGQSGGQISGGSGYDDMMTHSSMTRPWCLPLIHSSIQT